MSPDVRRVERDENRQIADETYANRSSDFSQRVQLPEEEKLDEAVTANAISQREACFVDGAQRAKA